MSATTNQFIVRAQEALPSLDQSRQRRLRVLNRMPLLGRQFCTCLILQSLHILGDGLRLLLDSSDDDLGWSVAAYVKTIT